MASRTSQIALTIITVATALALSAGMAVANSSNLHSLVEVATSTTSMGAGPEFSGATYNPIRNTILTVDDGGDGHIFQLNGDGEINQSASPHEIALNVSDQDFEGIAWIEGDTYGLLSEDAGIVMIVDLHTGMSQLKNSDIQSSFQVAWGSWGNLGPEGLATDGDSFFVTTEMPATLSKFTSGGQYVAEVDLFQLADASGVAALTDGTYLVISDESRAIAHYDIDWELEEATLLAMRDAELFDQLEGIAVVPNSDVHIFGEDKPGQTYAQLHGEVVPTGYAVADVNCSGDVDVIDAVIVARINSGIDTLQPGCGNGDHNGDGFLNIFDAVAISQCQVGIPNAGCPDIG